MAAGHVPALNCTVTSHYGDGMFTQHPNSKGYVYNVSHCISGDMANTKQYTTSIRVYVYVYVYVCVYVCVCVCSMDR